MPAINKRHDRFNFGHLLKHVKKLKSESNDTEMIQSSSSPKFKS